MRTFRVPDERRPAVTRALLAAVLIAAAVNCWIIDRHCRDHGTTPAGIAAGLWKYGPIGVFKEPPIPAVSLRDGARRPSY